MLSLSSLTVVVWVALVATTATPIILIALVLRDLKRGELW